MFLGDQLLRAQFRNRESEFVQIIDQNEQLGQFTPENQKLRGRLEWERTRRRVSLRRIPQFRQKRLEWFPHFSSAQDPVQRAKVVQVLVPKFAFKGSEGVLKSANASLSVGQQNFANLVQFHRNYRVGLAVAGVEIGGSWRIAQPKTVVRVRVDFPGVKSTFGPRLLGFP